MIIENSSIDLLLDELRGLFGDDWKISYFDGLAQIGDMEFPVKKELVERETGGIYTNYWVEIPIVKSSKRVREEDEAKFIL